MARLTTSHDSGSAATQLVGDTIGAALAVTLARQPEGLALVSRHQGLRWTWEELAEEVERAALGLLALGIEQGDRVGIWSPNCAEWTVLQFACAGGRDPRRRQPRIPANEVAYALGQSGVRLLVTAETFKTSNYLDMLAQVRDDLPALERVVTIGTERAGHVDDMRGTTSSASASSADSTCCASARRRSTATTRSTSNTRAARPATPRARRSPTTTSSTTAG